MVIVRGEVDAQSMGIVLMLMNALNDFEGLYDAPRIAETILALMPDSGG